MHQDLIYRRGGLYADGSSGALDPFHVSAMRASAPRWRALEAGQTRAAELDPAGPVVIYGRPLQWRSPSKVVTERGIEYTESFSGPGNLVQPCAPPLVLSHGGDIPGGPPVLSARTTVLPDALGLSLRWELREDLHPATVAFLTSQVLPLSVSFRECHPDGSEYRQSRYSSRPHRLPRRALIFHVAVVAAPAYPRAATLPPAA